MQNIGDNFPILLPPLYDKEQKAIVLITKPKLGLSLQIMALLERRLINLGRTRLVPPISNHPEQGADFSARKT